MTDDHQRTFIYRGALGNVTLRRVVDVSESDTYLQGLRLDRNQLRTFRKDRILEQFGDEIAEGAFEERLEAHRRLSPPQPKPRPRPPAGSIEVCFTGFKAVEKAELISIAEVSGFLFVRPSVTKNLHFLICGENAGPAKVRKARAQGVIALNPNEFRTFVTTGEIPDEGP